MTVDPDATASWMEATNLTAVGGASLSRAANSRGWSERAGSPSILTTPEIHGIAHARVPKSAGCSPTRSSPVSRPETISTASVLPDISAPSTHSGSKRRLTASFITPSTVWRDPARGCTPSTRARAIARRERRTTRSPSCGNPVTSACMSVCVQTKWRDSMVIGGMVKQLARPREMIAPGRSCDAIFVPDH